MKTTAVIYHRADFDGLFSREIAKLYFGDAADYIGWDYGDPLPVISAEVDTLYMIDISVAEMMDDPRLVWIDHHKTAIAALPSRIPGYRIDGVAACRLAWQWFEALRRFGRAADFNKGDFTLPLLEDFREHRVEEPLAVRLAGEHDVWDHRDPRAAMLQHGLRSCEVDWPILLEREGWAAANTYVRELLSRGEAIAFSRKRADAALIGEQGFTLQFEGVSFLAVNAPRVGSDLFETGLKPEHDACLGFSWNGTKRKWKVSLRGVPGKPSADLAAIAIRHGGGGHKQACGFECVELPFDL